MKKELKKSLLWLLIPAFAVLLAFLINTFLIINARVPSGSMEPVINENALVIGSRLSYRSNAPERGDIVMFRHDELGSILLVKRIAAIPGESLEIRRGRVYIDGELLDEPYITAFSEDDFGPVTLPEDCYFMIGDNRAESNDARFWENPFVPRSDIKAKVLFSYFPKIRSLE